MIEQAVAWIGYANIVSVAVPRPSPFFRETCLRFGVGAINVSRLRDGYRDPGTYGRFQRRLARKFELAEEQRDGSFGEAGNASPSFFSPFKRAVAALEREVRGEPGIALADALKRIDNGHYSSHASARASIVARIDQGLIRTLAVRREAGAIRLYPARPKPVRKASI